MKVAFLDRDGVINKNAPEHQYILTKEQFFLNPGITEVLHHLKKQGYQFIVLTNQRGIARGMITEKDLTQIHDEMKKLLGKEGFEILDIFYCPHEDGQCDCRKPKPGLLKKAFEKYSIDLVESLFITDSAKEIPMAENFGIKKVVLVPKDHPEIALEKINNTSENANKISACLVVYNEEKVIEKCLSSIRNLADEIILVHDGECSDRTLEIAKKYTDKIFIRPHAGAMEAHLVFAYRQAKYNWNLRIDADEYFDEEAVPQIKELIADSTIDGVSFKWEMWDGKKAFSVKGLRKMCLFRVKNYQYINVPNEGGKIDGNVRKVNIFLRHRPRYDHVGWGMFFKRVKRFTPICAKYFFPELVNYDCFNTTVDQWVGYAKKVRKYPAFYLIYFPAKILVGQLKNGLWMSWFGINMALQQAFFNFILYLKVWQMKKIYK